jgi:hypothetical protein
MNDDQTLAECWRIRNAAAVTLALTEEQMRRAVQSASVEQLVALFETFSPARSAGPEWTRTFDPLVEHLWAWRDSETIAAVAEQFRARGMPWASVANALSPERGAFLRAATPHPSWAREPAFGLI